jgi:hypothetical protein
MREFYFLRLAMDYLEDAKKYQTKSGAVGAFRRAAKELYVYDQRLEGAIHIAPDRESLAEYPDWVLSVGPKGGIRVERA